MYIESTYKVSRQEISNRENEVGLNYTEVTQLRVQGKMDL